MTQATDPPATPAQRIIRGVRRDLALRGHASITEFTLASGRRADVLALGPGGEVAIIEVKSSIEDFRADGKWPEYREFCDAFWFAVDDGFPTELIPADCGLLVADPYGAAILRPAPIVPLHAARRRRLLVDFALTAAARLHRIEDPAAGLDGPGR